jgi:hypothetical protein
MLRSAALNHVAVLVTAMLGMSPQPSAAAPVAFDGEKTTWHGFTQGP